MLFFTALLVDGLLASAIYALVALAFVVVYKASGAINFALGELAMLGSRLVATGIHAMEFGRPARSARRLPAWSWWPSPSTDSSCVTWSAGR